MLEAAKKQGREEIEVQDVSDWPEKKAISFMIADNRLAEIAVMDDDLMVDLLKSFDDPLDIPGVDEVFLESLNFESLEEEPKEKEIDENIETEHECPKCGYKF